MGAEFVRRWVVVLLVAAAGACVHTATVQATDVGPLLCVGAGGTLALDVRFYDAPPAGVRLLREPGGEVVASFHGRFGRGAGSGWRAGAGSWQADVGAACYRLVGVPDAPGASPVCLIASGRVGFAFAPEAPLFATVRYRGARLRPDSSTCEAFPAVRDAAERASASLPAPAAASAPQVMSGRGRGGSSSSQLERSHRGSVSTRSSRSTAQAAEAPPDDGGFPWPPPRPSTRRLVSRPLATGGVAAPTLGGVADHLQAALESTGYVEYGYYPIPGGFALATRLERIHPDGRAYKEPARWQWGQGPLTGFDLGAYVRALFDVEQGRFRVIVFVVTDAPLETTADAPLASQALAWPGQGALTLPAALRDQVYRDEAYTAALVYEFESRGRGHEAGFRAHSSLTGDAHLRQAGLLAALQ